MQHIVQKEVASFLWHTLHTYQIWHA